MAEDFYVTSGKFSLRYRCIGKGVPVLIPGSALYYPRVFSQNFLEHFSCVFADHRGFAPSPGEVENSEFEISVLLNDIDLVRRAAGLEQIIILGHSGHGYLALEYAKKFPQHVLGVVLIGTGPDQSDQSFMAAEKYFEQLASQERKKAFHESIKDLPQELKKRPEFELITKLIRFGPKSWYDFTFDSTPLWDGVTVNMQMFNYVWGNLFKTIDVTRGLEYFEKPCFVALGKYDFIVSPPYFWDSKIPRFKKIEAHLFEKSGHTPQYEQPELFDRLFFDWVARNVQK